MEIAEARIAATAVSGAVMRIARALLTRGPSSTADLAAHLGVSSVLAGRHLETLREAGWVTCSDHAPYGPAALTHRVRRRGRPARVWSLTHLGRRELAGHPGEAVTTLRQAVEFIDLRLGADGVREFADAVGQQHAQRWQDAGAHDAASLADVLGTEGFAAIVTPVADGTAVQLCQHHCPIREVAAEHPEFCEAETKAIAAVLGRNVVRLETMARGGHVCTTLIPDQPTRKETPTP